jgi:hypothetical protein
MASMPSMFGDLGNDLGQIPYLPAVGFRIDTLQASAATATGPRLVVDLAPASFDRYQFASLLQVTGLATPLAVRGLRLRVRLGVRMLGRGWLGRVARSLPCDSQFCLEIGDFGPEDCRLGFDGSDFGTLSSAFPARTFAFSARSAARSSSTASNRSRVMYASDTPRVVPENRHSWTDQFRGGGGDGYSTRSSTTQTVGVRPAARHSAGGTSTSKAVSAPNRRENSPSSALHSGSSVTRTSPFSPRTCGFDYNRHAGEFRQALVRQNGSTRWK